MQLELTLSVSSGVTARHLRVRMFNAQAASLESDDNTGSAVFALRSIMAWGVAHGTANATLAASFSYTSAKTPVVATVSAHGKMPARGTTAGNTLITIKGSGFSDTDADVTVTVGGTDCPVQFANTTMVTW